MSVIMLPMMGAMDDQPAASKGLALGDQPQAGVAPSESDCSCLKTGDETTDEAMKQTHAMQKRLMAP